MGRYTPHGTHANELLGQRGKTEPKDCTYCTEAASKGFIRCPSCETPFVYDQAEGYPTFDDDKEPAWTLDEARLASDR
jgi:hypothetical protein